MSIGIVIATFNRALIVGRAIESALAQGQLIEAVVVVDDGSNDSTPEVLARYAERSPVVEIVRHGANMGPSVARNHGLGRLMGRVEAVAILDSDDWLLDGVLGEMFACLSEDETISQVLGYMASEDGDRQGSFSRGSGLFSFEDAVCGNPSGDFFRLARSTSLGDMRFNEKSWGGEGALWARLLKVGDGLVLERTVAVCERIRHDRLSNRLNLRSLEDRLAVGRVWAGRDLLDVAGDSMRERCAAMHNAVVKEAARWALYSGDRSSSRFLAHELDRSRHPFQAAGLRVAALTPVRVQRALLASLAVAHRYWPAVQRADLVKPAVQQSDSSTRILATNINLSTTPGLSPSSSDVASWGWISDDEVTTRARLVQQAAWDLRKFNNPDRLAAAYIDGKRLFPETVTGFVRAVWWVFWEVNRRDAVVFAAPPGSVRDRFLWAEAIVLARARHRQLEWYSEDWMLPTGLRNAVVRVRLKALSTAADRVLVPSELHRSFHRRLRLSRPSVVIVPSIYSPSPASGPARKIRRGTADDPLRLLYVGRPMAVKGLDRAISLAEAVTGRGAHVRLRMVLGRSAQFAGSDSRYLDECIRRLASNSAMQWDIVDHTGDIDGELERADVLLAPNRVIEGDKVPAESWGRIVEEARIARIPILSTDAVPAAVALLTEESHGRVVPWQSDQVLVDALWQMLLGR